MDAILWLTNMTVGRDTKFDNLCHVAHSVEIGERCLVAAGAVIAGSVTIGNDVWVGPKAVISSKISIGDRAFITLGSVVVQSVDADARGTSPFPTTCSFAN